LIDKTYTKEIKLNKEGRLNAIKEAKRKEKETASVNAF
jgi:hypothetical protein